MDTFSLVLLYAIPVLLVIAAFFTGTMIERRHYASIRKREQMLIDLPVVNFDDADGEFPTNEDFGRADLAFCSRSLS